MPACIHPFLLLVLALSSGWLAGCRRPAARPPASPADGIGLVGATESLRVALADGGLLAAEARVDTGAELSSINAKVDHQYKKDGEWWLQAQLFGDAGRSAIVDLPLVRRTVISGASDRDTVERCVVRLTVELGAHAFEEEFTLSDRSGAACPAIIGRNLLRHGAWVDVSRDHLLPAR